MENPVKTNATLTAVFNQTDLARKAWLDLAAAGYEPERMSWMMSKEVQVRMEADQGDSTGESAVMGLFTGASTGAATSLLTAFGVAAGGPLGALLAAGVGAAGGGLVGLLVGAGYPHKSATTITEAVPNGGVVIAVGADSAKGLREAERIIGRHGGKHCHTMVPQSQTSAHA